MTSEDLLGLLPLLGVVVLFYLLLIRPQQRRARELSGMQQSLATGDEIVLTSGIHARITGLEDETVTCEIAPGVEITAARGAVGINLTGLTRTADETDATDETEDR